MANLFPSGGTNNTTQTYTGPTIIGAGGQSITNTASGVLAFEVPGASFCAINGSLSNAGSVTYAVTSVGGGGSFLLGDRSASLTQTGGTLSFVDLNETTGATVSLNYGAIFNDTESVIDIEAYGASSVDAFFVGNLTNFGIIKIVDFSGAGMISNWGNATGAFVNGGTFAIDDATGVSGSTTNFAFKGFTNSGRFTLNLPAASTAIIATGSGGLTNSGILTIVSHGLGGGNIQIAGSGNNINTGTIIVADANLVVGASVSGSGGVWNLSGGANLTLGGLTTGSGQLFSFSGGANTLKLLTPSGFAGTISGFSQGDQLIVTGLLGTPSYNAATGDLTVGGASFHVGLGYSGAFSEGANGIITYTGAEACFLPGTLIACPDGQKPVEQIVAGDQVVALQDGARIVRTVAWVGQQTVDLTTLDDPEGHYPVRIGQDAIAHGVPFKDLLLTAEHCLFLEGGFVPVRLLVNGGSIRFDRAITRFTYHHVETETHSVILADGVQTESYLDTGNRAGFAPDYSHSRGHSTPHRKRRQTWDQDAAAALSTERTVVEPLWHRLAERSATLGQPIDEPPPTTDDPEIRILLDDGRALAPCIVRGRQHSFLIPAGRRATRLLSRAASPAAIVGPFVDDRRSLGIAVEKIVRWTGLDRTVIDADCLSLPGWYGAEGAIRWTAGSAALDLPSADIETYLDVHVADTMRYLLPVAHAA